MALKTRWSDQINLDKPWDVHPRPQFKRADYEILNGRWSYEIIKNTENETGDLKEIIVPFPLESLLSGVEGSLKENEILIYHKDFKHTPKNKRTILHFEAVDQECAVYLNDRLVGSHAGGYTAFEFDVTEFLQEENHLKVKVIDKSNLAIYTYGKQTYERGGIWYTPCSGIWQSVWLEDVGEEEIKEVKITPHYDQKEIQFNFKGNYKEVTVEIYDEGKLLHTEKTSENSYTYTFEEFIPWNTENPHLYDVIFKTSDDEVHSYFGMRKFEKTVDHHGRSVFALNGEPVFLNGLLDQGYISDGIYTYPCLEAIEYELKEIKKMGFNMLRKHIKVENAYFYHLCDKLGILVMQDMMSGGSKYDALLVQVLGIIGVPQKDNQYKKFARLDESSKKMYFIELEEMIHQLYNYTSLFSWVPFNEGWGQFDALKAESFTRNLDPTRLIDHASGWFDQGGGDFASKHVYFWHYNTKKDPHKRIILLSEFGGYTLTVEGHMDTLEPSGYRKYKDSDKIMTDLIDLYNKDVIANIKKGLAGSIYTQVSDVEDECNGLFTYDRELLKFDPTKILKINEDVYKAFKQ